MPRKLTHPRQIHAFTSQQETSSEVGGITRVDLVPGTNDGLLANFASVLVRPDGYLAHVRPAGDICDAEKAAV
jgi:hypothetical protein